MGMEIKALLVGVCDYSALKLQSLPLCKNEINLIAIDFYL